MSESEEDGSDFGSLVGSAWHWDELCLDIMRSPMLEVCKHPKATIVQSDISFSDGHQAPVFLLRHQML